MKKVEKFTGYKQCTVCQKPLPKTYADDICPQCMENILFNDVKEFIRANDVNEYQVAEYFHIPLRKVKEWIKEGRIEYKENNEKPILFGRVQCQRCGGPVTFGILCQKCLKVINNNIHGYDTAPKLDEESKMRFFETEEK